MNEPFTPIAERLPKTAQLPQGWRWARLSSVARLESGHTPSRRREDYWGGDVRWLSLADIRGLDGRYIHETSDMPSHLGIANSSARVLPKGTVAFCRTASVGKTVILGRDMATSQDFVNWVCGEHLHPEYLHSALLASGPEFNRLKQGSTHKTIYMPTVERFHVALPPLPEQRRIADILDKADAIRRKRQEAVKLADEFLRSAFLEMFGDPVMNPKGWPTVELGSVLTGIDSGWSPTCDSRPAEGGEWAVLKLGSVTWGRYDPTENKALLPGTAPRPELEVAEGDLLFARKNTYELVGATAYVHRTPARLLLPDLIFRLRTTEAIDPVFLWQALSRRTMRIELTRLASGTAGSMPNISKARLRLLKLALPPKSQQIVFREIAVRHHNTSSGYRDGKQQVDDLFDSLVQRAFRGEL